MKTDSGFITIRSNIAVLSFVGLIFASVFGTEAADDRVKIENDQARVLVVTSTPGAKSELHEHTMNRVMIYLDAGKMTLTDAVGKVETVSFKAGEALWSPATTQPHVSLNVSGHPVRIVEIELKSNLSLPSAVKPPALDWVKVDPKHCKVEIENDQVRVIRARYGPHEKGVMHEHALNYVVAFLTEGKLTVTPSQGEPKTATVARGGVSAGRPSKHVEENGTDQPFEVVLVEFKK